MQQATEVRNGKIIISAILIEPPGLLVHSGNPGNKFP
jgi:hypothetical protein